jgi:hypothetical protein
VYIGGRFSQIGGEPIERLARWDGTRWYSLGNVDGEVIPHPSSSAPPLKIE